MKLKRLFIFLLTINIFALISVVLIVGEYQHSIKKLQFAYELQHRSFILADQLRQSSDDLTRMARTYVITANKKFEDQFHTVLDIRNGKVKRPENYNRIYWDFLTLDGDEAVLDGEQKSLRKLMQESGFPKEELQLLYESAKQSDDLTHLETKAMNAVKGIFQDKNGNYTKKAQPDLKLAAQIMHSNEYHRAKINIMKPIDAFYKAFEKRTKKFVFEANEKVKKLESLASIAIFVLIVLVLFSFFILLSRIVYPLETLKNTMFQLSKNDMNTLIPLHQYNDEVGEMIGSVKVFKENGLRLIQKEEKLKNAIKDAEFANNSKSIFLANMSHELRTPLNAILGFTSLLEKSSNIDSQEKENLLTIKNSGNHLLSIINEILELSKIEVGKIEISNNDFDLYTMIEDIKMMFISRFEAKSLRFEIDIDDNVPQFIQSDQQRLKQILINLFGNGLKFTQEGYVKCTIKYKYNQLYFTVEDTGIGISKKYQKKIFKPFEQINSNKFTKNGTGLGLAITKELISLLGGRIDLKSEVEKGSIFTFSIRFKPSTTQQLDIETKKEMPYKKENMQLTILVVDDIKENRNLLVQILKQYDIQTIESKDGNEALDVLSNFEIDLVFMDIIMPNLNGYETIKIIKDDDKLKTIPIVVVSANVFEEDKKKALDLGIDSFLPKPINDKSVMSLVHKHTQNLPLSNELIVEIKDAIKRLDGKRILDVLETSRIDKKTKKEIEDCVKEFRFDAVLKILSIT
ncbi:ATP-binding protein [Arcobacteraceae bacterium]|nr:ATP-binding protein [Arcobacteraceae bacterium]